MPEPKGFDVDFKLLPPELQVKLWILALDADTSKVALSYKSGQFQTGLAYNYGGNAEASLRIQQFSAGLSLNPSSGDAGAKLGYTFRGFRFGATASFTDPSVGLNLGYGAPLLPMPADMAKTFYEGAGGLGSVMGDIQNAPNDPLAWYKLHSNDVSTISKAVELGQKISKQKTGLASFGANAQLKYAPTTGLLITVNAGVMF